MRGKWIEAVVILGIGIFLGRCISLGGTFAEEVDPSAALPQDLVKETEAALEEVGGSLPSVLKSARRYMCGEFILYTSTDPKNPSMMLSTSDGKNLLFFADVTSEGGYKAAHMSLKGSSSVSVADTDKDGIYDYISYNIPGADGKFDGLSDDFVIDYGLDGQADVLVDEKAMKARKVYVGGAWHEAIFADKGFGIATDSGWQKVERTRTGYKLVHAE